MDSNNKAVWHLDATAIAEFESIDAAIRALNEEEDEVYVTIGEECLCIKKHNISIMTLREFSSL